MCMLFKIYFIKINSEGKIDDSYEYHAAVWCALNNFPFIAISKDQNWILFLKV